MHMLAHIGPRGGSRKLAAVLGYVRHGWLRPTKGREADKLGKVSISICWKTVREQQENSEREMQHPLQEGGPERGHRPMHPARSALGGGGSTYPASNVRRLHQFKGEQGFFEYKCILVLK